MRVMFPSRILDRHVGGNTTYARRLRDELIARGVDVGSMPSGSHPVRTMLKETQAAFRREPGTVLHYSADTGPLLRGPMPSVLTIHGVASRWTNVARNRRQEAVWRFRVKRAARSTDRIVTVSKSAASDIAEVFGIDQEEITVIYHGIDREYFSHAATLSPGVASAVPRDYVLFVGNVEPRKNIDGLVRAFQTPEVRSLGLPLVIAGRPAWNFAETMAAIEAADNVIYLGFVDDSDRVALMQSAALFAFPSRYEGFGFPVLEAMAAGAPVITSREGSLAEVAGPSARFLGLSIDAIAAGLVDALANRAWVEEYEQTRGAWLAQFTWQESAERHMQIYRELLAS